MNRRRVFTWGAKRPGREVDHSFLNKCDVKIAWFYA
jgi:hypothetical protein